MTHEIKIAILIVCPKRKTPFFSRELIRPVSDFLGYEVSRNLIAAGIKELLEDKYFERLFPVDWTNVYLYWRTGKRASLYHGYSRYTKDE